MLCATPLWAAWMRAPPRSSLLTISPVAAATSAGPAAKIVAFSSMITRSLSSAVIAPCPAEEPVTTAMLGTWPESRASSCMSLGA